MQKTFASIGVLGGLVWIGLALISFRWGVPGIVIYQSDDWAGRLGTLALVGITLGFFSFFRSVGPQGTGRARNANSIFLIGLSLMILSSFVYFWLSPKFGGVENKQFSSFLSDTFLVGVLFAYLASAAFGWNFYRSGNPEWLGIAFLVFCIAAAGLAFIDFGLSYRAVGALCVVVCGWQLLPSAKPQ